MCETFIRDELCSELGAIVYSKDAKEDDLILVVCFQWIDFFVQ